MQPNDQKELLKKYILALDAEIEKELSTDQILKQSKNIQAAIEDGLCTYPSEFLEKKYNQYGETLLQFNCNEQHDLNEFKTGRSVEIFNQDGQSAQGQVGQINEHELIIKCEDTEIDDWIKKGKIGLKVLSDIRTLTLYKERLAAILATDHHPYYHFFDASANNTSTSHYQCKQLNTSQNEAVNQCLSDNKFTIIHGPPGTGKTTTLVAAIKKMTQSSKRVLVAAPSNAAVDHIVGLLMKDEVNVLRLGNELKVDEKVAQAFIQNKIHNSSTFSLIQNLTKQSHDIRKAAFKYKRNFGKEQYEERKRLRSELKLIRSDIRKIRKDLEANILSEAAVICGTFHSLLKAKLPKFDHLIIDEAAQAIAPAVWSISELAEQIVLAGDHQQLPATIKSDRAKDLELDKSVLEMAQELDLPMQLLDTQYRMNAEIIAFSNHYFYGNQLKTHASNHDLCLEGDDLKAVEFIDTAGCGYEESKHPETGAIFNESEISIIEQRVQQLKSEQLAIITPYRAQLTKIRQRIPQVNANTIDSFQGQEQDVIIISLCRCNEVNEIGFLKDYRRMNVAFTRARKKLIVIGDSITIGQDEFYCSFLEHVEQNGSYRSAWEFMD